MENIQDNAKRKYRFQYVLESDTQYDDQMGYCNYYDVEIFLNPEKPDYEFKTVGKASFCKVLLSKGINDGLDLFDFFDMSSAVYDLGQGIFDFEKGDIKYGIEKKLGTRKGVDILYLYEFEILPEFRKIGLGHRLLQDIYVRFNSGCQFMVTKVVPLTEADPYDPWGNALELDKLMKDPEFDRYKLYSYFQKLGFQNHLNDEFFFINPAVKNDAMDKIVFGKDTYSNSELN